MQIPGWLRRGLALSSLAVAPAFAAPLVAGSLAPADLGLDAQNQPLRLDSLHGRVVVVSFWASWCAPCLAEMRVLENLQQRVGRERLVIVGINWRESRRQFRHLLERLGPVALTLGSDADGRIGAQYGVEAIPQLFVIDRAGVLAYVHSGYDPETIAGSLLDEIASLLDAPAPPALESGAADRAIMPP